MIRKSRFTRGNAVITFGEASITFARFTSLDGSEFNFVQQDAVADVAADDVDGLGFDFAPRSRSRRYLRWWGSDPLPAVADN